MTRSRVSTLLSRGFHSRPVLFGAIVIVIGGIGGEAFQEAVGRRQLGELNVLAGPAECAGGDCYEIQHARGGNRYSLLRPLRPADEDWIAAPSSDGCSQCEPRILQ